MDRKSPKDEEGEEIIPLRSFITRHDLERCLEDAFSAWMSNGEGTRDSLVEALIMLIKNPRNQSPTGRLGHNEPVMQAIPSGNEETKGLKCEVCGKLFRSHEAKFRNDSCGWRHVRCHV